MYYRLYGESGISPHRRSGDLELAVVVAAWADLPEPVRARIVGVVEGATAVRT